LFVIFLDTIRFSLFQIRNVTFVVVAIVTFIIIQKTTTKEDQMKYLWVPTLIMISVLLSCIMIAEGFGAWAIFGASCAVGAALGYTAGLFGYYV